MSERSLTIAAPQVIRLNGADNVVVTAVPLIAGTPVDSESIVCGDAIPRGHKVATRPISRGDPVLKFSRIIGYAAVDIALGEHVHTHNCVMGEHDRHHAFGVNARPTDPIPEPERATFEGFVRSDGRVGTRNFIAIVSM